MALELSLIEIKHVLQTACVKLFESDNSKNISFVQLFLAGKGLKAGSKTETPNTT